MSTTVLDRLSRQDAQILALGRGNIRGHTAKVMLLAPTDEAPLPTLEAIRDRIAARIHLAPRFRRRIVPTPLRLAAPVWCDDPDFALERHVELVADDGEELDLAGIERVVAGLLTLRLDRAHPLWHLAVVPRVAGGGMALIWRVHHALADGTSCVRIASGLLWDRLDDGPEDPAAWRPTAPPSGGVLIRSGLAERLGGLRRRRGSTGPSLRELPALPGVLRRELRRDAASTALDAPAGVRRRVAFASLSLAECHDAGKAIDERVTVNDVLLATIAGGLREWLPALAAGGRIRVKVPVSLHGPGDDQANHDSYFFTELPVHEPDPVARVLAVSRETRERKLHHDAEALYQLGLHPAFAHATMSPHVFTFNVSNVPGPRGAVTMLGARVAELYSLAEIADRHALRVAVISLNGRLFVGLNGDADAAGDLAVLAAGIVRAGTELTAARA